MDLVIVHRVNTDGEHRAPKRDELRKLVVMILDARTGDSKCLKTGQLSLPQ